MVDDLADHLAARGYSCDKLHGGISQATRERVMAKFRKRGVEFLVATDVAARGIDLPHVGIVIHADLPHDVETLQHRSGRTGRAGKKGVSALLTPFNRRRSAERLLSEAGVDAAWVGPPTATEVRALDNERFLADPALAEPASEDDLDMARRLLSERGAEAIAAALVRLYRARLPAIEEIADPGERPRETRPRPVYSERPATRQASEDRDGRRPSLGGAWFRINIGRAKGADPKWLLPMICRAGGLAKADVGAIRVFDQETQFEISAQAAGKFSADVKKRVEGNLRIEPLGPSGSSARGGKPDKRTRAARKAQGERSA